MTQREDRGARDARQPFVSVVLCNHNYGRFVAQAIESVLGQSHENLELIAVDDGSTDESREVLAGFDDARLQLVFQENRGQPAAYNAGFQRARGEIVALLDSDDWWSANKLETVVRWDRFLRGEYGLLQHGLDLWEEGETRPYRPVLPSGDFLGETRRSGRFDYFVPASGLSFRKKVLDEVFPIPEQFRIAADAFVSRAALAFGKLVSIPEVLGCYRVHPDSVSRNGVLEPATVLAREVIPALNAFYRSRGLDFEIDDRLKHRWLPAAVQARLRPPRRWLAKRIGLLRARAQPRGSQTER